MLCAVSAVAGVRPCVHVGTKTTLARSQDWIRGTLLTGGCRFQPAARPARPQPASPAYGAPFSTGYSQRPESAAGSLAPCG